MKTILLLPVLAASLFLFAGCTYDEPYGRSSYSAGYGDTDFYYVESRPYSRRYGPLYHSGGQYYYSSGGRRVVYSRPTVVRRHTTRIVDRRPIVRSRERVVVRDRRPSVTSRSVRRVEASQPRRQINRSTRVRREAVQQRSSVRRSAARARAAAVRDQRDDDDDRRDRRRDRRRD